MSERLHKRKLRLIQIAWEDRHTNASVRLRAKTTSIEAILAKARLRWYGHVVRMSVDRFPKQVLYAQLPDTKRTRGRPLLR